MPSGPRRVSPRASRLMIDLFHAVAECGHLIAYWDVAGRRDGVLLRARSRLRYSSELEAADAAQLISKSLRPAGYEVREISAAARTEGDGASGWHAFVELLVS